MILKLLIERENKLFGVKYAYTNNRFTIGGPKCAMVEMTKLLLNHFNINNVRWRSTSKNKFRFDCKLPVSIFKEGLINLKGKYKFTYVKSFGRLMR